MVKNLLTMQETWVRFLGQENPLAERMAPTPVFLPGESHGQSSMVGYNPWSCKVRHNWVTNICTLFFKHMISDKSEISPKSTVSVSQSPKTLSEFLILMVEAKIPYLCNSILLCKLLAAYEFQLCIWTGRIKPIFEGSWKSIDLHVFKKMPHSVRVPKWFSAYIFSFFP